MKKKSVKNNPQCGWRLNFFAFFRPLFSPNTRWPTPSAPSSSPCSSCAPHSPSWGTLSSSWWKVGATALRPRAAAHLYACNSVFKCVPLLPPPLDSGTPSGLKYSEVRDSLLAVKGVTAVHNLHIWALTMNQAVLSAHVAIGEMHICPFTIPQNVWAAS